MTYQLQTNGPFVVSRLSTYYAPSTLNPETITLDDHRTSRGLYIGSPLLTGLAFSDMTTQTSGGTFSAVGMHRPSTQSGTYGSDCCTRAGGRAYAGSCGVALTSGESPEIQYRSGYNPGDNIVNDSYMLTL